MQDPCRPLNLDDAAIFVVGIDLHSRIIVWNDYAAHITGFPGDRALGMNLFSCFQTINKRNCVLGGKAYFLRRALNESMKRRNFDDFVISIQSVDCKAALIKICLRPWTDSGDLVGLISIGQNFVSDSETTLTEDILHFIELFNDSSKAAMGQVSSYFEFRESGLHRVQSDAVMLAESISKIPDKIAAFVRLYQHEPRGPDQGRNRDHLFDIIDSIIFGLDHLGNVHLWNSKSAETFGIVREDIIGRNFLQVFIVARLRSISIHYEY